MQMTQRARLSTLTERQLAGGIEQKWRRPIDAGRERIAGGWTYIFVSYYKCDLLTSGCFIQSGTEYLTNSHCSALNFLASGK